MSSNHDEQQNGRRAFLRAGLAGALGTVTAGVLPAQAQPASKTLRVWSCGGLAEAMNPAHAAYREARAVDIAYTGAFAAVLGKSLLASGRTDVFAGRVLALARSLRKAGRMKYFVPLCFTSYVIAVPKGNPANIKSVEDMARQGVKVAMAPKAPPPGGDAANGLLKAAGVLDAVKRNVLNPGSCVQRSVKDVCEGKADAMIVERRITRMPSFAPYLDLVEIPEKFYPAGPLTFTVGLMEEAEDIPTAEAYIRWISGPDGGVYFDRAGFIPASSPKGQELVEKLGVKDVA